MKKNQINTNQHEIILSDRDMDAHFTFIVYSLLYKQHTSTDTWINTTIQSQITFIIAIFLWGHQRAKENIYWSTCSGAELPEEILHKWCRECSHEVSQLMRWKIRILQGNEGKQCTACLCWLMDKIISTNHTHTLSHEFPKSQFFSFFLKPDHVILWEAQKKPSNKVGKSCSYMKLCLKPVRL